MEDKLEIIKANLPFGYEKMIAKEAGCSVCTVNNILNDRAVAKRSSFRSKVLSIATRIAGEQIKLMNETDKIAKQLGGIDN